MIEIEIFFEEWNDAKSNIKLNETFYLLYAIRYSNSIIRS